MLNNFFETRIRNGDTVQITLEANEKDYFGIYGELNEKVAADLLKLYLLYHNDDARFNNVKIKHDHHSHIVKITADLSYLGNDHTDLMYNLHDYVHGSD